MHESRLVRVGISRSIGVPRARSMCLLSWVNSTAVSYGRCGPRGCMTSQDETLGTMCAVPVELGISGFSGLSGLQHGFGTAG